MSLRKQFLKNQQILTVACLMTLGVTAVRATDPADVPVPFTFPAETLSSTSPHFGPFNIPNGTFLNITYNNSNNTQSGVAESLSVYVAASFGISGMNPAPGPGGSASFSFTTPHLTCNGADLGVDLPNGGIELVVTASAGSNGTASVSTSGCQVSGQGVKPGGVPIPNTSASSGQVASGGVRQINLVDGTVSGSFTPSINGANGGASLYFEGVLQPYGPGHCCPTCPSTVGFATNDISGQGTGTSSGGVNLASGASSTGSTILSSVGTQNMISPALSVSNFSDGNNDAGAGWDLSKYPKIGRSQAANVVIFTAPGDNEIHFLENRASNGTVLSYTPLQANVKDQVVKDSSGITLIDTDGNRVTYDNPDPGSTGKVKALSDPFGNSTYFSYDTQDRLTSIAKTTTSSSNTTLDTYTFASVATGSNAGLPDHFDWTRSVNGGTPTVIRRVTYAYYQGTYAGYDAHGNAGDLESIMVTDASNVTLEKEYYRYFTPLDAGTGNLTVGYSHGLKFSFNTASLQRLVAAKGDPTTTDVSDADAAPFATKHLQYDATQRVTLAETQGTGCSCSGSGQGAFSYTQHSNPNTSYTDGYNNWKTVTLETLPDNNVNIVYSNFAGEELLKVNRVYADPSHPGTSAYTDFPHLNLYDGSGRVFMTAEPSAFRACALSNGTVSSQCWDDTTNNLVGTFDPDSDTGFLRAEAGLCHTYGYDDKGHVVSEGVQQGFTTSEDNETWTEVASRTYTTHTDSGNVSLSVLSSLSTYATWDTFFGKTTNYTYTWVTGTNQILTRTITKPPISPDQNGPAYDEDGNAAPDVTTEYYDSEGRVIWTRDADGHINYTAYDPATGAVVKTITDVLYSNGTLSAAERGSFDATGWAEPTAGLNLVSTNEVDMLGRTTTVTDARSDVTYTRYDDADHIVRVYPAWDGTHYNGPVQITSDNQAGSYKDSLLMSSAGLSAPPSGSESISSIQTLSRQYVDNSGRVIVQDRFYDLPGGTLPSADTNVPALSSNLTNISGSSGKAYRTQYAFDAFGRQNRVEDPVGDITRTVYDGLGRVSSMWMGTDDTPATDYWSPSNTSGTNLVKVSENLYDNATDSTALVIGDGVLTQVTRFPDTVSTHARVTQMFYDWRERLVATKGASDGVHAPITAYTLDESGNRVTEYHYDGISATITPGDGTASVSGATALMHKTFAFDDQDRVYQTTVNGNVNGGTLTTNTFYDHRGNVIATYSPGGIVRKSVFDGAGRLAKTYTTDGASDSGWASASSLAGNHVFEQTEYSFDNNGNTIETISRSRNHDETATGELASPTSSPKARVRYSTAYYDAANRVTASVNYGTDGSSLTGSLPSVPSSSDTVLVSTTSYDASGWSSLITDPKGNKTSNTYDRAGRVIQTVENYDPTVNSGNPTTSTGHTDANRTTQYTYDGLDHTITLTAVQPTGGSTPSQTTQYTYGVTATSGGSSITLNNLLATVNYPSKSSGTASTAAADSNTFTYDALGEVLSKTDQNGTIHTYTYDTLGRTTKDAVTLASGNPQNVDNGIAAIGITFDGFSRPYQLTSYDGSAGIVNRVQRSYDDFGNILTEYQSHSGDVVTASTPKITYTRSFGSNYNRLTGMTYPNGRSIYFLYSDSGDVNGLANNISRITAISSASSRGSSDANVIASYDYLGLATIVRKNYPVPAIRLDRFGGTSGTYAGLDQFDRIINQEWTAYNASTSPYTNATNGDMFKIGHGYDRDSNRLYADNQTQIGAGHAYTYDGLNRLTNDQGGSLNASTHAADPVISLIDQNWSLDPLGNPTASSSGKYLETFNAQNQIATRKASDSVSFFVPDLSTSATSSNLVAGGSNDAFDINTTRANALTITGLTSYTSESRGLVLFKQYFGHVQGYVRFVFDSGSNSGDEAGMVFGYKSINDYWLNAINRDGYNRVYHVVSGVKSVISATYLGTIPSGVGIGVYSDGNGKFIGYSGYASLADGYPSGQIGFYTNRAGTYFDSFHIINNAHPSDILGRWDQTSLGKSVANNRLNFVADADCNYVPMLLRGLRLQKFQATFGIRREVYDANNNGAVFVFGAKDADHFNALNIYHIGEGAADQAPSGSTVQGDSNVAVSGTVTAANLPTVSGTDVLWACVACDGSTVTVKLSTGSAAPSDWSTVGVCYTSSAFDTSGGLFGFNTFYAGYNSISNFTVKSYNAGTSSFDITEAAETFGVDGSGYALDTLSYDANGNLAYDGLQAYTYDAWNRLKTVAHAYTVSTADGGDGTTVHTGHVFENIGYDAAGRRITKAISGTGAMDAQYHSYYSDQSVVEERLGTASGTGYGPGLVIKQQVWGLGYVDEAVQTAVNSDPMNTSHQTGAAACDRLYWLMQDANYNVLGVVNASGTLVERYEYSAYGQRQVFTSAGVNDPGCYTPSTTSSRVVTSGSVVEPYGINEVGHQGLVHDEETNLVYNRARMLNPPLGRFMQEDPLSYINSANLYEDEKGNGVVSVDPSGKLVVLLPPILIGLEGTGGLGLSAGGLYGVAGAGSFVFGYWLGGGFDVAPDPPPIPKGTELLYPVKCKEKNCTYVGTLQWPGNPYKVCIYSCSKAGPGRYVKVYTRVENPCPEEDQNGWLPNDEPPPGWKPGPVDSAGRHPH